MLSEHTKSGNVPVLPSDSAASDRYRIERIHETWVAFIHYCATLKHGEIERLKIQDGLPVLAEVVREKIKFTA